MTRTSTKEAFIRHTLGALREAETQLPSDVKKALARAARAGTSARMSKKTPAIVKRGVTTIIGKGGMSSEVILSFASRCLYLAFSRGCGILAKDRIEEVLDVLLRRARLYGNGLEVSSERLRPTVGGDIRSW